MPLQGICSHTDVVVINIIICCDPSSKALLVNALFILNKFATPAFTIRILPPREHIFCQRYCIKRFAGGDVTLLVTERIDASTLLFALNLSALTLIFERYKVLYGKGG